MKALRVLIVLLLATSFAETIHAAATQADLILSATSARPGDTITAGVRFRMKPDWHIYWRNPGGPGQATKVEWNLPPGIKAGEIRWPMPAILAAGDDLSTYIYENEVVLIVPLKIADDAPKGPLELKASTSWVECKKECILGSGDISARINIGDENTESSDAPTLRSWAAKIPPPATGLGARATWEPLATTNSRALVVEWKAASTNGADFYPYGGDNYSVQFFGQASAGDSGTVRVRKMVKLFDGDWPKQFAGLLVQSEGTNLVAHECDVPIAFPQTASIGTTALPTMPHQSLVGILLYAFLGGLILNVMPCVLPVIALKILGFVSQSREHPGVARKLGLIYAAGVLVSFLALALLVIGVKVAGHQAGWGLQFGSPRFIVVMTVVITLVALNLFGLFEINAGGRVMGAAGELTAKEGPAGAFFNGVLATILATPCTAPFLGVALGFALSQSYAIIVTVLLTVGVGLAFPYVVLSWNPALLKILPRPGAWMEKFKIAMGFPMLATVIWLYDLATVHYGSRVLWLALFLVMVALAAWIYGEFVQRGRKRKGLALAFVLFILGGGYAYAIEDQLNWRAPLSAANSSALTNDNPDGIAWKPWSVEAIASARAAGHPVLVDFTARWCQICRVNENTSLDVKRVQDKLKEIDAVSLVADYTLLPENMTKELNAFGRSSVPLVLVYPADAKLPPEILPDGYLTPGIVLDALDKATKAR